MRDFGTPVQKGQASRRLRLAVAVRCSRTYTEYIRPTQGCLHVRFVAVIDKMDDETGSDDDDDEDGVAIEFRRVQLLCEGRGRRQPAC